MNQSVQNRKARYNYFFLEKFEAGIELRGSEIKSLRNGRVDIAESFAREVDNEIYLINFYLKELRRDLTRFMGGDRERSRKRSTKGKNVNVRPGLALGVLTLQVAHLYNALYYFYYYYY